MNHFFLFFRLLFKVKFTFKNPEQHDLVIFDDVSLPDLKNFIFHYNFFVLQNRIENINKIYFSFKILKYFFKYYNGNIMTAYLISLLEIIRPKIVLTFIDNSFKFFDLARVLDKKINFVAVQNAARYELKEHKHRYKKNITKSDFTKNFYIPNFLCFGQFEIDHYKQYKIKVKNFFKVGSLRLANFFYYIKKKKIKLKKSIYDICLVSESYGFQNDWLDEKNFEKCAINLTKFTIKFCMKHNMRFIFPLKNVQAKGELGFYKKYLTDNEYKYLVSHCLKRNIESYSSYMAMFQSKVAIGTGSTLLRENLAVGGKTLACNLTRTNVYDFPIKGICSMKNCTFKEFEKRLLRIYSMSKKNYFSKLSKDKCYTAEYDKKISTIDILKRRIDSFLANNHQ